MAAISWKTGVSGDWSVKTDWSSGTIPAGGDDVSITASGVYTVTIKSAEAAHSVLLNASGAKLVDSAALTLGGTLTLGAGAFTLAAGGNIVGGTVAVIGGKFIATGGTLSGVTYQGSMVLGASASAGAGTLNIKNGITLDGPGGTGPGTISLSGKYGGTLNVLSASTLDNAAISIGGKYNTSSLTFANAGAAGKLTLGPQLSITQTASYASIGSTQSHATDGITNQGTISAGYASGHLTLTGGVFTNQGSILVSNGETVTLSASSFANSGTIAVASGGILSMSPTAAWSNTGVISETGGTIDLGGTVTNALLSSITRNGGAINVSGTIANTGSILNLGSGSTLGAVELSGTIVGGTIADAGGGLGLYYGTLSGVTYQGTLSLGASSYGATERLYVNNGITLAGAGGTGSALINMAGTYGGTLTVLSATTLNNAVIDIGGQYNTSSLTFANAGAAGKLTLGPQLSITQTASYASIGSTQSHATDGITNQGTISAGYASGHLTLTGGVFTNQGSILVSNGETVTLSASSFANSGTIAVASGGILSMSPTAAWSNTGVISETGGTIDLGGTVTNALLSSITRNGGAINVSGTIANTGSILNLGSGSTLGAVELSGTIVGGTIADAGGGLGLYYGTLSGVTYQGTLSLGASSYGATERLYVNNGITLAGAGGTGSALINMAGTYGGTLTVLSATTLNNAVIDIGGQYNTSSLTFANAGAAGKLTLGPQLSITQTASYASIGSTQSHATDGITNQGTISAGYASGHLTLTGGVFTNQGSILVSNGETVTLSASSFANSGTIAVASGGILSMSPTAAWSNTGVISETGGTIDLGGTVTNALLSSITRNGGAINVSGTIANTGSILNLGSGSTLGAVELSGTIVGGTIADAGGGLGLYYGTLSGVTYQGTLSLGASSYGATERLYVNNGITLAGAGGTGSALINMAGTYGGTLTVLSATTLNNAVIDIGGQYNTSSLTFANNGAAAGKLTLGPQLSVVQTSNNASIGSTQSHATDGVTNQGTISAGYASGHLTLNGGVFTNQGSILVSNGETVAIGGVSFTDSGLLSLIGGSYVNLSSSTRFTNLAASTFSAGALLVGAGSVLQMGTNLSIATDSGTITLSGQGSSIQSLNSKTNHQVTIDSTLKAISANSVLSLQAGRTLTAVANGGTFSDAGTLMLGGGAAFNASLLTLAGGTLFGAGVVNALVSVSGSGAIAGGSISISSALTGTGSLTIGAGAGLALQAGGQLNGTVAAAGLLALSGGSFTSSGITLAASGVLGGYGTVSGPVSDAGVIDATGGTLSVSGLSGISGGTWSGGGLEADAASTLQLGTDASISLDAGSITLSGAGSAIDWMNSATGTITSLDATLAGIAAGGSLSLLAGRNFTAVANAGTFADSGKLLLAGGTFAAGSLLFNNGAMIVGSGSVGAPIILNGTAALSTGTLSVGGIISGNGTLGVSSDEVLQLAAGASFNGTLSDQGAVSLAGATIAAAAVTIGTTGTLFGRGAINQPVSDAGLIDANGGSLLIGGLTSVNAAGTLTTGQLEADAGAVLQFGGAPISVDASSIALNGAGSTIQSYNTATNQSTLLESSLASIAASGTLTLSNGRSFQAVANSGTLSDAGLLAVNGGTLSVATLNVTATGTFTDAGNFSGAISNAGLVTIADSIMLDLTSGGPLGGFFSGVGTLDLAGSTPFTLAAGSTIQPGLVVVETGTSLVGTGTLSGAVEDDGTVTAMGGTLSLTGPITGQGTLNVAAGSTLNIADGGTFFGPVTGSGTVVNADLLSGTSGEISLAATGTLSVTNTASGEVYAGVRDAVDLAGGTNIVNNAGAIGGARHGLSLSGGTNRITNSGLITGDVGAAILASGTGVTTIVNTGVIANYEGPGVAAISLNGAASATLTNAGTIIGGDYLSSGNAAVQFGPGNDRLIIDPGAVFVGSVRGGGGNNTLELASPGGTGTLSGLGTAFQSFRSVVEDAAASWVLYGTNTLQTGYVISTTAGSSLGIAGLLALQTGSSISNAGSFTVAAGGTLQATGGTATVTGGLNDMGTVDVTGNATLSIAASGLTNLNSGTLTGGAFEVDGASKLQFSSATAITTDNATLIFNGAGGAIQSVNGSTVTSLAQSLATIGSTGTLSLVGDNVSTGALSDQGLIAMAGGTLTTSALTVAGTGFLSGFGTLAGPITDQGLIKSSGGTLTFAGAVSGSGTVGLGLDAVLIANSSLGAGTVDFQDSGGVLELVMASAFTGTIADFATSDTIDLLGTKVTGDSFSHGTLTLTGASGTIATLNFAGDYSGYHFGIFSDGHGGSDILLT